MNIELNKDHNGFLRLAVNGQYASGAEFSGISPVSGEMQAVITIPLKHIKFGQVDNVVPFVRPERAS